MKRESSTTFLSTTQVARGLGISVSTVKRWVEDGILPAMKTAGGHRKLPLSDVLDFAKHNNLPVNDLARIKGDVHAQRRRTSTDLWKDLHRALLSGDTTAVRAIVHGTYRYGMSIAAFADGVVGPAMHRIGKDWETGAIDVMHEHRASQLCANALVELMQMFEARTSRKRPLAVGAAPAGDQSVLCTLLAQLVLLENGWEAVNLGPNTPLKSLGLAIRELRPQLVWLSISHCEDAEVFGREYASLYRAAQGAGAALVIGGRALVAPLRTSLPYTAYGDSLAHLEAFAQSLNPRPRRPRRGRPPQASISS